MNNGVESMILKYWPTWSITILMIMIVIASNNNTWMLVLSIIVVSTAWTLFTNNLCDKMTQNITKEQAGIRDTYFTEQTVECLKSVSDSTNNEIPALQQSLNQIHSVTEDASSKLRHSFQGLTKNSELLTKN